MGSLPHPRSVEEIFEDFSNRRSALVKALTQDVDDFYKQCNPDHENLCLYGNPDGSWEVALPAEEVPPELPEPALGINFARDGMEKKDWLKLVAVHSDAWLLSVAFFYGAKLNKVEREKLFKQINGRPTVFETLNGKVDKQPKKQGLKRPPNVKSNAASGSAPGWESDGEEGQQDPCEYCGKYYKEEEFWIGCDVCLKWYHGKCVNVSVAKAAKITNYKCPNCQKRR
eukprot:1177548-Prorocentrum_minimum.AAC.2